MQNLRVGDKIIDLVMSEKHVKIVTPVITKINKRNKRIVCFDSDFPNNYPHSFYDFDKGINWKKLKEDNI